MLLYDHMLYTFEWNEDSDVLFLRWKTTTESMTSEDFKEALHNFAGFGFEYQTLNMLVDVRGFRFQMTPELGSWREEFISPRYVRFGLTKFGYIMPPEIASQMKDMASTPRAFEEGYFDNEADAVHWLSN